MPRVVFITEKKSYGFGHFVGDLILTFLTGGLWLVWLLFKFLRS